MNSVRPREYQEECVSRIQEARRLSNKSLVVMAPGLGKTLTCAFDLQDYLKTRPSDRVLVLCHSEAILSQTKDVFKSVFGDEYSYGMYNGREKTLRRPDFLFANLQSMNLHLEEFAANEFSYIVMDEAHHAPAETFRKVVDHFVPNFLLGMTATPDRMDGADLDGIFGETVYECDIVDAVRNGWLASVDYRLELDELQNLDSFLYTNRPICIKQLNRELFIPKRDEEIVRLIRERSSEKKDPTIVIFCQTINHAERIANIMEDAVVIHSELPKTEQKKRLDAFREGKAKVVCVVNMLNEGIDIPRTDIIVFLRVTQSNVIFLQQLGRGLRLTEGKDDVLVLDFVATADRLNQIFELEREFKGKEGKPVTSKGRGNSFSLNIDTPAFVEKKVDICNMIERAKAFRSAGMMTNDELVQLLADLGKRLGRAPSIKDCCPANGVPSHETYRMRFGSYEKALILAGYTPRNLHHRKYASREEMLEFCRKFYQENGKAPGKRILEKDPDAPGLSQITYEFGSLNNYVREAGCPVNKFILDLSREEMLRLLSEKCEQLGRSPSMAEVDADPNMPDSVSYYKRFGGHSLNTALELIGRKPNAQHNSSKWRFLTKEEAIELLREKQSKQERTLTMHDVSNDPDIPGYQFYVKMFGNFPAALAMIGRKPNRPRKAR